MAPLHPDTKRPRLAARTRALYAAVCTLLLVVAAPAAQQTAAPLAASVTPKLKLTAATPVSALQKLSDNDVIELPSGSLMRMKEVRRLSKLSQRLKAAKTAAPTSSPALRMQPAAKGRPITTLDDLKNIRNLPDTETVELAGGVRATAAQVKLLLPEVEKKLGKRVADMKQRPDRNGPVVKITASTDRAYWKNILQKPDNTVLESPEGKRITVGELKEILHDQGALTRKPAPSPKAGGRK